MEPTHVPQRIDSSKVSDTSPKKRTPTPASPAQQGPTQQPAQRGPVQQPADSSSRRSRWRRAVSLVLQIGAALILFALIQGRQTRGLLDTGPDRKAPAFVLMDVHGRRVSLEDYAGKSVLLHFWATWCGVCRQEFGALRRLAKALKPEQALLTIVADSGNRSQLSRLIEQEKLDYPILLGNADVLSKYKVSAFPTNYYITPTGSISQATVGMSTRFGMSTRLGCAKR